MAVRVCVLLLLWSVAQFRNHTHGVCADATRHEIHSRDAQLEVALHAFESDDEIERMKIFPRRVVPQVRRIFEPVALWMAVNIREIALLPGDRLVLRDSSNTTTIRITASNQSVAKDAWKRPLLWDHPFLMFGNHVTIEYWPSLLTLALPIDRRELDNHVVVIESYTYMQLPRRSLLGGDASQEGDCTTVSHESTVGATNEMKPAICYKNKDPIMYANARPVARLIIRREDEDPPLARWNLRFHSDRDPGNAWTFCTGWLVGRGNHLMSNYHCFRKLARHGGGLIPSVQSTGDRKYSVCGRKESVSGPALDSASDSSSAMGEPESCSAPATVNFMAETASCSDVGKAGERAGLIEATSVRVLAMDERLDYCLLRLERNGSNKPLPDLSKKYGYLTLRASGPVDGEPIYIPQHPNGEPKEIASTKDGRAAYIRLWPSDNATFAAGSELGATGSASYDNISVWYNADTAPGSSGSPVLSQTDNAVIALHHAGSGIMQAERRHRASGRSRDGDWDAMAAAASTAAPPPGEQFNIGIRIDAIVADLQQRAVLPPCALARACKSDKRRQQLPRGSANSKSGNATHSSDACCTKNW